MRGCYFRGGTKRKLLKNQELFLLPTSNDNRQFEDRSSSPFGDVIPWGHQTEAPEKSGAFLFFPPQR
jgi:hypothetical protein